MTSNSSCGMVQHIEIARPNGAEQLNRLYARFMRVNSERSEVSDHDMIELVWLPILPTHLSAHIRSFQGHFSIAYCSNTDLLSTSKD